MSYQSVSFKYMQAVRGNAGIRSQAASLVGPLAKLVDDGASKLAQRATGVSALLACCYIAAASHEADEVLKQHKVNSVFLYSIVGISFREYHGVCKVTFPCKM